MDRTDKNLIADANKDNSASIVNDTEDTSENPVDLYAKLTAQKKAKAPIEQPTERFADVHHTPKIEKKEDSTSRFATEQTDLSYVNPLALNTQPIQAAPVAVEKPVSPINMQDIIDQLVEKVVQMETGSRSDTVITLKHPPILAGADLVVTGFDSAKGEFNITFQKLTQAAKNLLDMHSNQQSLLLALEQKGYAVHIVTTTTVADINLPNAQGAASRDRERNQEQSQEQNRGEQGQPRQRG